MARGYTERKLEVWSLVAHLAGERPVDYLALFEAVASVERIQRITRSQERAIAVLEIDIREGKVYLGVDEGPWGQPLILDTETATESTAILGKGQVIATRTHALVDLASQEAIVEYNLRGAKARDIAFALEDIAHRRLKDWSALEVDLRPKADLGFIESIDQFERIKAAGFRIGQPNFAWTDWADDLAGRAKESNAQTVEAEMTAGRGQSLSRVAGIVPYIKERAKDAQASLKTAFVTGRRPEEEADTSVTLNKHTEHQRVSVRLDPDGRVDEKDMRSRLAAYDASRHPPDAEQ